MDKDKNRNRQLKDWINLPRSEAFQLVSKAIFKSSLWIRWVHLLKIGFQIITVHLGLKVNFKTKSFKKRHRFYQNHLIHILLSVWTLTNWKTKILSQVVDWTIIQILEHNCYQLGIYEKTIRITAEICKNNT